MHGTQVRSLVQEDPTCCRATKPVHHKLLSLRSRAREPQLLKPACLEPMLCSKRSQREATTMRSLCTTTKSSPHSPQLEKTGA